jgi:hypothetical protein
MEAPMNRRTVLAGALAAVVVPSIAAAAEPKRFKCHARLERESDHKEARTVDAICLDGQTVTAIDGDKDYKTSPPTVMGLRIDFTAKSDLDGKIALRAAAVYRTTKVTIVGGLTQIGATMDLLAPLAPGEEYKATMDVDGTPYTLRVSVTPVA